MDPPNTCNRMRCECDKALAEKLQIDENEWNIDHHRRWGVNPFDSTKGLLKILPHMFLLKISRV